jgi:hypothetical protein
MIGTPTDASIEKCLIAAKSTIRLVSCADQHIAQILRPVWAHDLPAVPRSVDEIPAQLDLGGPVRKTQKSNAVHASGRLFSPKNKCLIGWESHLEKMAMILLDCDPAISRYYAQPMTLRYELDGHQRHYTPDIFTWREGQPHVLEIKPYYTAAKEKNRLRFALFKRFFRAFGVNFSVLDETVINVQPRQSNCSYLLRYHDEVLSATDLATIGNLLSNGGASVEMLARQLGGSRPADRIYAYILRGHARIDHRHKINSSSLVLPLSASASRLGTTG